MGVTVNKINLRVIISVVFSALFLMSSLPYAQAQGVELRSENFILKGDISEREAKRLVKDLEIFRLSLFKMLNQTPRPEKQEVEIFAFRDVNSFQEVVKNKTVAGVYSRKGSRAVFVLNAQGGFKEDSPGRRIAMHEYVHHIISAYTNQTFPRWYNEGYANFLANFKIKKNKFIIGAPDRNYAWYLKNRNWMPMEALINSVKNYPFKSGSTSSNQKATQQAFYAQSWLAVTMMQTNPDYAEKSKNYLFKLDQGEDSLEAFQSSFNMSPDEFGDAMKAFVKKDYFLQYPFPLTKAETKPPMALRKMSEVELNIAKASAVQFFN